MGSDQPASTRSAMEGVAFGLRVALDELRRLTRVADEMTVVGGISRSKLWRQMLADGQAPPLPDWVGSFYTPESEVADLGRGVHDFQKEATFAFWEPEMALLYGNQAAPYFQSELEGLLQENSYVAHQLVRSQVRSFDLQSPSLAVVTVREYWQDTKHELLGYPDPNAPVIAQRGPYTLDVTYTLEWNATEFGGNWQVVNVVFANEPPAWE